MFRNLACLSALIVLSVVAQYSQGATGTIGAVGASINGGTNPGNTYEDGDTLQVIGSFVEIDNTGGGATVCGWSAYLLDDEEEDEGYKGDIFNVAANDVVDVDTDGVVESNFVTGSDETSGYDGEVNLWQGLTILDEDSVAFYLSL